MSEIKFISPDECKECGWKPVESNNENQSISIENKWLLTMFPGSVIAFFVCPACTFVHVNKNALENVKSLQERQSKRIIEPPPGAKSVFQPKLN
jgi:hypothetical protein